METRLSRLTESRKAKFGAAELHRLKNTAPAPDPDAVYAARITLDLATVSPWVSGPDSVQIANPLNVLATERIAVSKAYLVSCVNSRLGDLSEAAEVVRGKRVADGVELYVAASSQEVETAAKESGAWQDLVDAGALALSPGCGPCIGLGTGLLQPGEVGISATNRNFKGRMGSRDAQCYLASPAVVAASAVSGYITGTGTQDRELKAHHEPFPRASSEAASVSILEGFPALLQGRVLLVSQDNLNTDGIYGKDYTYRDDVTEELMAKVVMENYDPGFTEIAMAGDILVGGFNFGTGSSREQAVTALQAKGISLVIAGSYSQTYLRNAFNNGLLCIECPDLLLRLRDLAKARIDAGTKTIVAAEIVVDFSIATVRLGEESFGFPALGSVPQALVVAKGVENQVRARLGLA